MHRFQTHSAILLGAVLLVLASCSSPSSSSVTVGAPATITIISGDGQTAAAGAAIANPLVVQVKDQSGNLVPDATVTFQTVTGSGVLFNATPHTDAHGRASLGSWVLGPLVGANTLTATVGSVAPLTFTATATPAPVAQLLLSSGDAQTTTLGATLPNVLSVKVADAFGNGIAGVTVTFVVTSGSGTVLPATALSNALGLATTVLTLTGVGVTTVRATSAAFAPVVFTASTGPTLVGQLTIPGGPVVPFSGVSISGKSASLLAAVTLPRASLSNRMTGEEKAKLASTRGHLVVSFRPEAFGLPPSANAYAGAGMRAQAVAAYREALRPLVDAGQIIERELSPAIAAVRVEVAPGANQEAIIAELKQDPRVLTAEEEVIYYTLENGISEISPAVNEWLQLRQTSPLFAFAPPATERYTSDPYAPNQLWHYRMVDVFRVWPITTGSSAVRVAIIDTGNRSDHPAMAGMVSQTESYDFTDGVTPFYSSPQPLCTGGTFNTSRGTAVDIAAPRNLPQDPRQLEFNSESACWQLSSGASHGTHVAGTIASAANDGVGGTGLNWNANIIAIRVLGVTGSGWSFDVAQGILYAGGLPATYTGAPLGFTVQMPAAHVANMSIGGPIATVIQNAVTAASVNTLFMAAAGNSASSSPSYPGGYPEVVSVVALDPAFQLANYTNVGSTVDISAPGGDFRLGATAGVLSSTWDYPTNTPSYTYYEGTSMATPHVTGVAALVKAANPSFTAEQIRSRLLNGAVDLGAPGRDDRFGAGAVNAYRSVTGTSGPTTTTTVRAIDATGAVARTATVGADGRFAFTNMIEGSYLLFASQDEGGDGSFGIPGRRFGGLSVPISVSGTTPKSVAFTLGALVEVEPNDDNTTAQPLAVNSWVAGQVGGTDPRDIFSVMIPTAGTYTFETSGVLGACGTGLDVNTLLRVSIASGGQIGFNDDTPYPTASYPGSQCSLITLSLTPGRYYIEVSATGTGSGTYRLHVRAGG